MARLLEVWKDLRSIEEHQRDSAWVESFGTEVGGTPELITPETGQLVPSADPKAMSRAMAVYALDEKLRRAHGCNARHRIETRFALPVMIKRYHSMYTQLLGTRSGEGFE